MLSEIKILQDKWKKSEIVNKKLLLELEQNINTIKSLENKIQEANIHATLSIGNTASNATLKNNIEKFEKFDNSKIRQATAMSNNKSFKSVKSKENIYLDKHDEGKDIEVLTDNEDNINLETWLESKDKSKGPDDIAIESLKRVRIIKLYQQFFQILNKLKLELKAEKIKVGKLSIEISKAQKDRSNTEKIFQDCIESTKKEILARKAKATLKYGNK